MAIQSNDLPPAELAEGIHEISRLYWNSAVLRAAIQLGLFPLLAREPQTAAELAQRLEAAPRYLSAFLDACTVLGLIEKDGPRFRNSAAVATFLVPGHPWYSGDLVAHSTNHWNTFGHLAELVRTGRSEKPFENGFVDAKTFWSDYMKGQHGRSVAGQGQYLADRIDLSGRRKMLDLGGGAGSYSLALCRKNPELRAAVIDRKECLDVGRELVRASGCADQISFIEGDVPALDLGTDSDVVLISGVFSSIPDVECKQFLAKAYSALTPGGLLIVQDLFRIAHDPARHFFDTMVNLYLLVVFNAEGGDRPGDQISGWIAEAGFVGQERHSFPTQLGVMTAVKPAIAGAGATRRP